MEIIKILCWVTQFISALSIVILVLLQQGKGAESGVTFGSGGNSGSLFGASGSTNFLSRTTAIFATVFFISTFILVILLSRMENKPTDIMRDYKSTQIISKISDKSTNVKDDKNQMPN